MTQYLYKWNNNSKSVAIKKNSDYQNEKISKQELKINNESKVANLLTKIEDDYLYA